MPRPMRYTLAAGALLIAGVSSVGWVLQMRAGSGPLVQMVYAAGAGVMVGLAIWALRQTDNKR